MATTTFPDPPISPTLTRRPHSVEGCTRMTAMGFFDGERLELIESEFIKTMPQKSAHRLVVSMMLPVAIADILP